jgi:hypothetical protein
MTFERRESAIIILLVRPRSYSETGRLLSNGVAHPASGFTSKPWIPLISRQRCRGCSAASQNRFVVIGYLLNIKNKNGFVVAHFALARTEYNVDCGYGSQTQTLVTVGVGNRLRTTWI